MGVERVVAKAAIKKQGDTNGRFSDRDIAMYTQWVNNPLQGLDRCILTLGMILGLHC